MTKTHGYFIGMGGFHLFEGSTPLHPLDREFVVPLILRGTIKAPTEVEIQDKSKTNGLTHALVFFQTLWFATNCLVRAASSLPITKLEVVTIAYILIYVWIYITLWGRPHYVDRPIPLQKAVVGTPDQRRNPRAEGDHPLYVPFLNLVENRDRSVDLSNMKRVPITYSGNPNIYREGTLSRVFISFPISAAVHCISWSSKSLSFAEMVLWRLFSLGFFALFIGPLAAFIAMFIAEETERWLGRQHYKKSSASHPFAFHVLVLASFALYSVARIGLVALAIIDLREVPRKGYEEIYWTTFIPHF